MSDLQKYKKKQLEDPGFKAEYERTRPDYEIMHALVDARISQNLTQKELAEKSGGETQERNTGTVFFVSLAMKQ